MILRAPAAAAGCNFIATPQVYVDIMPFSSHTLSVGGSVVFRLKLTREIGIRSRIVCMLIAGHNYLKGFLLQGNMAKCLLNSKRLNGKACQSEKGSFNEAKT